jgi:hypothetical protein
LTYVFARTPYQPILLIQDCKVGSPRFLWPNHVMLSVHDNNGTFNDVFSFSETFLSCDKVSADSEGHPVVIQFIGRTSIWGALIENVKIIH